MTRKSDRLYALVEELRARAPAVIARQDLADRLEVTARTVERDILALQEAGVPIWSQRGRGGGYALDRNWSLPPLNFDATEALAVIAALATARSLPFAEAGRRAERKLLAAMSSKEADRAKELAGRLRLAATAPPAPAAIVAAVEDAVTDRRVVELDYRDRHGIITERVVEAHGLHLSDGAAYLVGWCRLRDDGRSFRLDRIVAVRPTGETAPPRPLDGMVDWVDDAVIPSVANTKGNITAMTPTRRTSFGPPRRADNTSGSTPAFVHAVASSLPGATSRTTRGTTTFSVESKRFATLGDGLTVVGADGKDRVFTISAVGRDETRSIVESAWRALAPKNLVTAHNRTRARRGKEAPVTVEDIRRIVLALPGAVEGPIWGQEIGFLIGTEKKTRFARFGPPVAGHIGNLNPPDDENALVILRCAQKPELLASCPERFFTTAHYGPADEPGGIITRLDENRGATELAELAELLEDAWREAGGTW